MPADYSSLYQSAGNTFNVDPLLAQAVAQVESNGNPNAVSRDAQGNPVAYGTMQITSPNLQRLNVIDPYNPEFNIPAGTRMLDEALTTANGNVPLALRIYEGGPDQSKWGPINAAYPAKVAKAYQALKAAQPPGATPAAAGPSVPTTVVQPSGGTTTQAQHDALDDFMQGKTQPAAGGAQNTPPGATRDALDQFMLGSGAPTPPPPPEQPQGELLSDGSPAIPNEGGVPAATSTMAPGFAKVVNAGIQGAEQGFGSSPLGASPQDQQSLVNAGIYNGPNEYNPLKAINKAVINPLAAVGDLVLRSGSALLRGGQAAISQAGSQLPAAPLETSLTGPLGYLREGAASLLNPLLAGQDVAGGPEAFPTGDTGGGTRIPQPDAVPTMRITPNVQEISPAAHDALDAPLPATFRDNPLSASASRVPTTTSTPTVTLQAGDRTLQIPAKSGVPVTAASSPNPLVSQAAPTGNALTEVGPQSVGAAASRDLTVTIPPETPEQKVTNLGKSVTQSAEDRAGPQLTDNTVYVPGVERPLAAREFSPQNSLDDKTLRATDPVYRAEQEGIERNNNQIMVDLLSGDAGDVNALKAAHDARSEVAPPAQQLFVNQKPVDASPLVQKIDDTLAGPDGKRAAVVRTLTAVRNSLFDPDGNLETLPSQLYGARQNITDLLKKGVGEGADDVRASKSVLTGLLDQMDPIINDGAPKYQAYLDQFHEASQPINQMEFLQKYQTGAKSVKDNDGYLQFNKVQKMLDDIYQGQKAKGINPAKSLTDEQIQNVVNVRNELAAQHLKDRLAKVKGSDTMQQTNRTGILGDGPLGTAVKGAAEMGAHAVLFHTTGGVGNAVMALHRGIVKPAREASKAAKAENLLAARKAELLSTQPKNPLNP